MKQMGDLGIKLTTIGNASVVAQTTLNNLSTEQADGGYAIGGMIPQTATDPKILDWAKRVQDKYIATLPIVAGELAKLGMKAAAAASFMCAASIA